jgi:hypothetical protein
MYFNTYFEGYDSVKDSTLANDILKFIEPYTSFTDYLDLIYKPEYNNKYQSLIKIETFKYLKNKRKLANLKLDDITKYMV